MRFADDTVLITGAGSGIGRATARRFADEGAHVVVTDVATGDGEETVDVVADEHDAGSAEFRRLDVTDHDRFESVVAAVDDERGLDVLVNNAGVGAPPRLLEETDTATRDHVLAVNAEGVWNGCHAALPALKGGEDDDGGTENDDGGTGSGGAIVNVASLAGVTGAPRIATYSLSKGAVVNFTRSVAAEAGGAGVRVNAVCPGFTETAMLEGYLSGADDREAAIEAMAEGYPLGRLARPEEVAAAVAFLASDDASFVTGHALVVDGGYSSY